MIRFSIILPTSGRVDLAAAARSARAQMSPQDELLIVGGGSWGEAVAFWVSARHVPHAGGRNWGHAERNAAMPQARGTHLLFLDDDDALLPGALKAMRECIAQAPERPHVFKMIMPEGYLVPITAEVRQGNIGTPNLVAPNTPARLGVWGDRYEGDFDFIASTLAHYPDGPVWHDVTTYACREHGRRAWGLR